MVPARPFFIGSEGCVRSSACTEDFSSMQSTTACSGGLRWRPTTSISFSSNRGSLDSLNVFTRCGLRPRPDQIRCTVAGLTSLAFAIDRQLQCVSPSGRGLKPHLVKTFKLSNDPRFEEKLIDVVGLYLNPPEQAVVLCMDEKSSVPAYPGFCRSRLAFVQ